MKKVNKLINRLLLFVLITLPLITSASSVYAAEGSFHKIGDWVSTWHSKLLNGTHWTEQGSNMMTVDGNPAFCIEHGIPLTEPGAGFEPSELSIPEKDRLALIAYYGYQTNPNALTYTITQHIIWETLGNELLTSQVPNYQAEKQRILNQVDAHNSKPSFDNQTIELNVGESITLNDSNGVLNKYKVLASNSANLNVEK
ncbi:thioester domain-containing protein [Enterococcus plantarum]|uniref:thioester domain-containing protein n=1 Tax=Enterococcus plantarum TaxID=1077675 RepID=UPI001F5EC413|nr:thioester domain-containing protein [Enterococcus plantarum]